MPRSRVINQCHNKFSEFIGLNINIVADETVIIIDKFVILFQIRPSVEGNDLVISAADKADGLQFVIESIRTVAAAAPEKFVIFEHIDFPVNFFSGDAVG